MLVAHSSSIPAAPAGRRSLHARGSPSLHHRSSMGKTHSTAAGAQRQPAPLHEAEPGVAALQSTPMGISPRSPRPLTPRRRRQVLLIAAMDEKTHREPYNRKPPRCSAAPPHLLGGDCWVSHAPDACGKVQPVHLFDRCPGEITSKVCDGNTDAEMFGSNIQMISLRVSSSSCAVPYPERRGSSPMLSLVSWPLPNLGRVNECERNTGRPELRASSEMCASTSRLDLPRATIAAMAFALASPPTVLRRFLKASATSRSQ